jgi:hypothetical protein
MRETLAVSGAGWIYSRILRSRARPSPIHDPAGGPEPPGASRIRPGFRGQEDPAETRFCPLKAGGVPGQGPGASRSREAAPGLPRDAPGANRAFAGPSQGPRRVFTGFSPGFRRVGKVARGPESEGARGSARRSRGRRGHAISENFDTWEIRAPKDLDDPARQRKKLWRLDAAASGNLGAWDEDVKKLWRCGIGMPKNFDARASRRQETLAGEGRKRHETLAPETCVFPDL